MLGSRKVHKGLQTTACGNIFVTNLFSPIPDQDFCCLYPYEIIRIYHDYVSGIEKSVPRITDWHHKACQRDGKR